MFLCKPPFRVRLASVNSQCFTYIVPSIATCTQARAFMIDYKHQRQPLICNVRNANIEFADKRQNLREWQKTPRPEKSGHVAWGRNEKSDPTAIERNETEFQ